jgi:hypothetical protein
VGVSVDGCCSVLLVAENTPKRWSRLFCDTAKTRLSISTMLWIFCFVSIFQRQIRCPAAFARAAMLVWAHWHQDQLFNSQEEEAGDRQRPPDAAHSVASLRNLREVNTYTVRRHHFPQKCERRWVKQFELT